MHEKYQEYLEMANDLVVTYGLKVLMAVIILAIGLWIIKRIVKVLDNIMIRREVNVSLRGFLKSLLNILLKVMLVISVAEMVGIKTTSFIAILGAAGLAIGLALQGTLANFAGGVMILLFKPFKVGDYVQTQGHTGTVKDISIFVTVLLTPQKNTVILPNSAVSNGDIVNYTTEGIRRIDMTFGISYDANIKVAKDILMNVLINHPNVLKDPAPFVGVKELADSSVNLAVLPFVKTEHYLDVFFTINEEGKIALENAGISIPFPQVDVHMNN